MLDYLIGDVLTEGTGRMLASVYNGDLESLKNVIENDELDDYARGQAAKALVILVYEEELDRNDVLTYFQSLIRSGKLGYYLMAEVICSCVDLYPEEIIDDITWAYEEELVEEFVINLNDVLKKLSMPKDIYFQKKENDPHLQLITDTNAELRNWACFRQEDHQKKQPSMKQFKKDLKKHKINNSLFSNQPLVIENKIGRNDPCSCGSGKKFKKCCGR